MEITLFIGNDTGLRIVNKMQNYTLDKVDPFLYMY